MIADHPYLDKESLQTLTSAFKNEAGNPPAVELKYTEACMAHWFDFFYNKDVKYVVEDDRFLVWNGRYWELDDRNTNVRRLISLMAPEFQARTEHIKDEKARNAAFKYTNSLENTNRQNGIIIQLKSEATGLFIKKNDLDKNSRMINCLNGVLDLDKGTLIHHEQTKEMYFTHIYNVKYDPEAICPLFDKFLNEITCEDADLKKYLLTSLGYCISGRTDKQLAFIFKGAGRNGKGVLRDVIEHILDGYAIEKPGKVFSKKHEGEGRFDLYDTIEKRIIFVNEPADGSAFNEALIKQYAGGDMIPAERKYCDPFMFKPCGTLIILTNTTPKMNKSLAMSRRIRVIPFNLNIDDENDDVELKDKLLKEISGILNRLIEGYMSCDGEANPKNMVEAVADATEDVWNEADMVAAFVNTCIFRDEKSTMDNAVMYLEFKKFCMNE
ncbi:hypothetical protein MCP_1775 [Methanocella paludicola SANAE]|uniref:SF3 helicase domain-containing protein n=1 Tax=Methanocella paludicola (strain DSM 17711 / JCM 13418 / NBRC 101707 / SANAE) TaxID=304371 RepID=D1YZH5_METPS|nr:phage/plasmid primase, P4 family [Methanocella paludicola]BAI61847.1 hypothetical protein MCP_1775 [Methanocella paludicola SANAE]